MPRSKKDRPAAASASKEVKLKVAIFPSEELGFQYVNHAEVGHSRHEFYMLWGRLPTKVPEATIESVAQTGTLLITPILQFQFPASMIGGLIHALTEQRAKYEEEWGPIKDTWKGQVDQERK